MSSADYKDAFVQSLYWPVVINTVASLISIPLGIFDVLGLEGFSIWTTGSIFMTSLLFLLTIFSGKNQRAVAAYNAIERDGSDPLWSRYSGRDRLLSVLFKIGCGAWVLVIFLLRGPWTFLIFTSLFGVLSLSMSQLKYEPDVHARVQADFPNYGAGPLPQRPAKGLIGRIWLFYGLAGLALCVCVWAAYTFLGVVFYHILPISDGDFLTRQALPSVAGQPASAEAYMYGLGGLALISLAFVAAGIATSRQN